MKKKVLCIIFFIILSIIISYAGKVYAVELKKADYSEKYLEWLNLPEEERKNSIAPVPFNIRKEEPDDILSKFSALLKNSRSITIPERFDLREELSGRGISLDVRNQQDTGACWTFSANSNLEAQLALDDEVYDFSERHMEYDTSKSFSDGTNPNALNRRVGNGGTILTAFTYYSRGSGPILEEDMPFENNENNIKLEELTKNATAKKVENMVFFPNIYKTINSNGTITYTDGDNTQYTESQVNEIRNEIKEHIMTYGAISASINDMSSDPSRYNTTYFTDNNTNASLSHNHSVLIVGWDDNFDKNKFNNKPSSNGAYIVMNSWGTEFGDNGFYYISYEDVLVETSLRGAKGISDVDYDNLYQYDTSEMYSALRIPYAANVFTAKENENLTELMIGSWDNQKCNIYVNSNGNDLNIASLTKVASNVDLYPGFTTITLDENVELTKGMQFAIVVEFLEDYAGIGLETNMEGGIGNAVINPNESFYSFDGANWNDLSAAGDFQNLSIKAYTQNREEKFEADDVLGTAYENVGGEFKIPVQASYLEKDNDVNVSINKRGTDVTSDFTIEGNNVRGNGCYVKIDCPDTIKSGVYDLTLSLENLDSIQKQFIVYRDTQQNPSDLLEIYVKTMPSKINYVEGDTLDTSGIVIEGVKADGSSAGNITGCTYSPQVLNTSGTQKITASYTKNGNTFETTFDVNVQGKVLTGMAITKNPDKVMYVHKVDDLDLTGGQITLTYDDESTKVLDMVTDGVILPGLETSGYDKNTVGMQSAMITYTENGVSKSATFNVVVLASLEGIQIKTMPNKVNYFVGESFSKQGMSVQGRYSDGSTARITGYTWTPTTFDTVGTQEVTIIYEEDGKTFTVSFDVTVQNVELESIEVTKNPNKVNYLLREELDLTGGQITVSYNNGNTNVIDMLTDGALSSGVTVSGYDKNTVGEQEITVTYTEAGVIKSATFNVTVEATLDRIQVKTMPTKVNYYEGDTLNTAGLEIEGINSDGTSAGTLTGYTCTPTLLNTVGTQEITVTYIDGGEEYSITFEVNVQKVELSSIDIAKNPNKVNYIEKQEIDLTGGQIYLIYNNGSRTTLNMVTDGTILEGLEISGYDKNLLGTQEITVKYTNDGNEFTTTFNVSVEKIKLASIAVTKNPDKTSYIHKVDELDLTGAEITATYNNADTSVIEILTDGELTSGIEVSGYDKNRSGTQTITVTYTEDEVSKSATFNVTVLPVLERIRVKTMPSKVNYFEGDTLDVAGIVIEGIKSDETSAGTVTGCVYSPTELNTVGIQEITVTYTQEDKEFTTTFEVNVQKIELASIAVTQNPDKTIYRHKEEELDVTGGQIDLINNNGSRSTVDIVTDGEILSGLSFTGYDKDIAGTQTITVTYTKDDKEFTTTFNVTVEPVLEKIIVKEMPSKVHYYEGDTLDVAGIVIEGIRSDESSAGEITGYTYSPEELNTVGTQEITVTYIHEEKEFTTTFEVDVEKVVLVKIAVIKNPDKTVYGHTVDELDLTGGKLELTYNNGSKNTLDMVTEGEILPGLEVTGYDKNTLGTQNLLVKYTEEETSKFATFNVRISVVFKEIRIKTMPEKVNYFVGDTLDLDGMVVEGVNSDGTSAGIITGYTYSELELNVAGTQEITITYTKDDKEYVTTFEINVGNIELASIAITKDPDKVDYLLNQELDLTGGEIEVTYSNGNKNIINILTDGELTPGITIIGYDKNVEGEQEVIVRYKEDGIRKSDTFNVDVRDYIREISLNSSRIDVVYGTSLEDIITDNDIKYVVVYEGKGAGEEISLEESMVTGYDPSITGEQTLTVTYVDDDEESNTYNETFEADLVVNVKNNVIGISMTAPTKTEYRHGENLDLSTMQIVLTHMDGTESLGDVSEVVATELDGTALNMTPTNYDENNRLEKTVILSLTKDDVTETVNYTFNMENDIKEIKMKRWSYLSEYELNEEIYLPGTKIIVVRGTEQEEVEVTSDMISGFDTTTLGSKVITVSYAGKETTYIINVFNEYLTYEKTSDGTGIEIKDITPRKERQGTAENPARLIQIPGKLDGITVTKIGDNAINPARAGLTVRIPSTVEEIGDNAFDGCDEITIECETGSAAHEYAVAHGMNYELIDQEIASISVYEMPDKQTYKIGENLDVTGGKLLITYVDSSVNASTISMKKYNVETTGFEGQTIGIEPIIITYKGHETSYNVTIMEEYLKWISEKTTLQSFKEDFKLSKNVKVYNRSGNEIGNEEYVGTGMIIEITQGENKIQMYAVVKGDLDGDGMVTIVDISRAQMHYIEMQLLSQIETNPKILKAYELAADTNEDEEIGIIDVSQIKMHYLKIQLF